MSAIFLEEFLTASPEFQAKYIEMQREHDRLEAEAASLRESLQKERQKVYEALPRWRRYWYEFFTWFALLPIPRF